MGRSDFLLPREPTSRPCAANDSTHPNHASPEKEKPTARHQSISALGNDCYQPENGDAAEPAGDAT
jgi:hypothetical protein